MIPKSNEAKIKLSSEQMLMLNMSNYVISKAKIITELEY